MKVLTIFLVAVCAVAIVSAITFSAVAIYNHYNSLDTVGSGTKMICLEGEEELCLLLFDCTPKEFFDKKFPFYKHTGDFRERAYIDEHGCLVLDLTVSQANRWKETWLLSCEEERTKVADMKIGEDHKTVIVYWDSSTANEESAKAVHKVAHKLLASQAIDGVPIEDRVVRIKYYDVKTGELILDYYSNSVEYWFPTQEDVLCHDKN